MAIVLTIKTIEGDTLEITVTSKSTIGRSSACDCPVTDKQMSGKHGFFELKSTGELIYGDLGSSNGSFLNNSQVHQTRLRIGDQLKLGNSIVSIDEKRLTPKERVLIGKNENKNIDISDVPTPELPVLKTHDKPKSVVLNKDLKKKAIKGEWSNNPKEALIEQEESSGHTKLLKLDIGKIKSKKK